MGSRRAGEVAFVSCHARFPGDLRSAGGTKVKMATGRADTPGVNRTDIPRGMSAAAPDTRSCSSRAAMMFLVQTRAPELADMTTEQLAAHSEAIPMRISGGPVDVARRALYPASYDGRHVTGAEL